MQQRNDLTGKPSLMKELNIGLIKDALTKYQSATRVELSSITGISQPTVNLLIKQLLKERTVISVGTIQAARGRKAEVFALNNKRYRIASLIVPESNFQYAISDMNLNREASATFPRNPDSTFSEQLCSIIRLMLEQNKYIRAISVGVPGAVSETGQVFAIPHIPEWERVNLKNLLEREFGLPVLIVNDINAIAVGYAGSVQTGVQDLVYLHVENNGIGAGIIINGRLYSGFTSFAGEIGYMQVASGKKAEDMLTNSSPAQRTALLGAIAANIICVLNPEKMVIGGKDIPDSLYEHVQKGSFMQLPEEIMPQIVIIDSNLDFYFQGLGEMGKKLLDKDIHLA